MTTLQAISLLAATLAAGLLAGLFYAFDVSVMPGLRRADDRTFVGAMQQINRAILNGWFMLSFLGTSVLAALAAALQLGVDDKRALPWVAAGLALSVVQLIITGAVNVPLNNALDTAGEPDRITDLHGVRTRFEERWARWNVVRTLTCTAAFGCLTWALVLYGRGTP